MKRRSGGMTLVNLQAAALVAVVSFGGVASSEPLTLEQAIRTAWKNSPSISSQGLLVDYAERDRLRRFVPNEPQLTYNKTDSGTAESYGIAETIAFPGKSMAVSELDTAKVKQQKMELLAKKYEITRAVLQAYLNCATAQAGRDLLKSSLSELEILDRSMATRYESGSVTQAERISLELQLRQLQSDVRFSEDKVEVACRYLTDLIGDVPRPVTTELPGDLERSIRGEFQNLVANEGRDLAAMEMADAKRGTAYWSQLPDVTFNISRNHYLYLPGSPAGKEWTSSYGVSLTFPILFFAHENTDAQTARAQATIERHNAQLDLLLVKSDRSDASREFRRSRDRLKELEQKDLKLAQALYESTLASYRSGRLGFAELVMARKTVSDIKNLRLQLISSQLNARLRCLDECEK